MVPLLSTLCVSPAAFKRLLLLTDSGVVLVCCQSVNRQHRLSGFWVWPCVCVPRGSGGSELDLGEARENGFIKRTPSMHVNGK